MENEDPVVKEIRLLSQRVDMLIQRLHETVVSSRVKNYTFPQLRELVLYFCESHLRETGVTAVMSGKLYGAGKSILSAIPLIEAKEMIDEAFRDKFFADKIRSLNWLAANPTRYRPLAPPPLPIATFATAFVAPWDKADANDPDVAKATEELNELLGA